MHTPDSPFYTEDHQAFRDQLRRFVEKDISPFIEEWEAAGRVPRELHEKAANIGLLGLGYPQEQGGNGIDDPFFSIIAAEELARAGSGGLCIALLTHNIATPPIVHAGTDEQKAKFVAPVLAGEKITALAITEPEGGSDVANIRTTAKRDGDSYIVNGAKTFITSGMRADFITTAVRTGEPGLGGLSLLVIEADTLGLDRTSLNKMGWQCSDTATLYFDNCRVPIANRVGPENAGFLAIMRNFNHERLMLISTAYAFAQVCYDEALAYARERITFGRALIKNQVIRHKLVEMKMKIDAIKAQLEILSWRVWQGEAPIAELCMLKAFSTRSLEHIAGEAVQILGGAGYIRGAKVERIFRETKVLSIGGGANEVMIDLASRQMEY